MRQCPQTTTFLKRKESRRRLTARPNRLIYIARKDYQIFINFDAGTIPAGITATQLVFSYNYWPCVVWNRLPFSVRSAQTPGVSNLD